MDFQTSIKTCFNKYAIFAGRASRSEFWWFFLFGFLGATVAWVIDVMIFGYASDAYGPMYLIFLIVTFLPSIAVGARRLHDTDKTGWWQLLWITFIGGILVIIWQATMGEKKKNQYLVQEACPAMGHFGVP